MIAIYHLDSRRVRNDAALADLYFRVTEPCRQHVELRDAAIRALIEAGAYKAVATIDGTDLDDAYAMTQNDPIHPSWSMMPSPGVTPAGVGYDFVNIAEVRAQQMRRDARAYGYEPSRLELTIDAKRTALTTIVVEQGVTYERQPFGYKSSSIGDLMVLDGVVNVVASFGFEVVRGANLDASVTEAA